MTFDYAVYEMSYANHTLYAASLPSYSSKKDDDVIDADDPDNEGKIDAFFNNIKD